LIGRPKRILSQEQKGQHKQALCTACARSQAPGQGQGAQAVRVRREGINHDHAQEELVLGARLMSGNPYDGHTLAEVLEQAQIPNGVQPRIAVVDRGNQGVETEGMKN
jgi:IS5 family transposase